MADLWRTISERHGELLSALGQHIEISLIALMIAVVIAIPLAVCLYLFFGLKKERMI